VQREIYMENQRFVETELLGTWLAKPQTH
jgi:hypothetical protein